MMERLQQLFERLPAAGVSMLDVLFALAVALFVGQLIAWCYMYTHAGVSYSRNFTQALILLCLILTLVMTIVGSNLLVAFGLLVAISMIRFRTPVRDTRDTAFVFLTLAAGMAIGTGFALLAVAGTVLICLVAAYLSASSFGSRVDCSAVLQFCSRRSLLESQQIDAILNRFSHRARLISINPMQAAAGTDAEFECAYEVELRDEKWSARLLNALQLTEGVANINLVMRTQQDEF